ncbi:MAG: hypothetical protein K2Q24_05080 [Chitinophagaceae bacterium]|nr:hypothetical protein [Chitinophagaceae bacterium]
MKKFQNLGTALNREQSKKIRGGDECLDCGGGSGGAYCKKTACTYYELLSNGQQAAREGNCGAIPGPQTGCGCNG